MKKGNILCRRSLAHHIFSIFPKVFLLMCREWIQRLGNLPVSHKKALEDSLARVINHLKEIENVTSYQHQYQVDDCST